VEDRTNELSDIPSDFFNDDDAELLQNNQSFQVSVPTPTHPADTGKTWIKHPEIMLSDLTMILNRLLRLCWFRETNGMHLLDIRPEYRDAPIPMDLISVVFEFRYYEETLRLCRTVKRFPCNPKAIHHICLTAYSGRGLHEAISRFRRELQQLANWIEIQNPHQGKDTDQNCSEETTVTMDEWLNIVDELERSGTTATKKRVRNLAKEKLGAHRTLASDTDQKYRNELKAAKATSNRNPGPRKVSDRTAD
jgi:hypothetical protein